MSIGFSGSRKGLTAAQLHALAGLLWRRAPGEEFHHGDAFGADEAAHFVALARGLVVVTHPSDIPAQRAGAPGATRVLRPKPPLLRNADIVDATDGLIACPSGKEHVRSGTWSTVRRAREAGRSVVIVWPDGRVEVERRGGER